MPQIEAGKTIEKLYWELVRKMSVEEKWNRTMRLNAEVRHITAFNIRKQHPELDEIGVKYAVVRRHYMDEPNVLKLVDLAEKTERASHE